jgi:tetratricopeptide (TPR) repeat protein
MKNQRSVHLSALAPALLALAILAQAALVPEARAIYSWFQEGEDALLSGRYQEAVTAFTRSIEVGEDSKAYYNRGIAYRRLGNDKAALADYTRAAALAPGFADAYNNRATIYLGQGLYAEAMSDCLRALASKPDHKNALNQLAWLYATAPEDKLRDGKKALVYARRAVSLSRGEDPGTLDTQAAAHAELGQFKEALATGEKALRLLKSQGGEGAEEYEARLALYRKGLPVRLASEGASETPGRHPVQDAVPALPPGRETPSREETADQGPEAVARPLTLQTGAFQNKALAEKRREELKAKGFAAWLSTRMDSQGKAWHIVNVGHYDNMIQAKAAYEAFTEKTGLASIIRKSGGTPAPPR